MQSKCLWKGDLYTIVLHVVFEQKGKECKVNVYGNEIFIQLFYTLYLNYIWKHYFPMNCTLNELF